jgi:hypothetical protein
LRRATGLCHAAAVDEKTILEDISGLVEEEHRLRSAVQAGTVTTQDEHERLAAIEEQLDQCWDLLRRRRAVRDNHGEPDDVQLRPAGQVESYLQ